MNSTQVKCSTKNLHKSPDKTDGVQSRGLLQKKDSDFDSTPLTITVFPAMLHYRRVFFASSHL